MLPFRHVGGPNHGQWIGLVDTIYGFAMTLMIININTTLGEISKDLGHLPNANIQSFILISFLDYVASFLILYEIWCFHKTILMASSNPAQRLQSQTTAVLLVIVAILPAYAVSRYNLDIKLSLLEPASQLFITRLPHPFYVFSILAIVYGLLAALARFHAAGGNHMVLELCRRSALRRCFISIAIFLLSLLAYSFHYNWLRVCYWLMGYIILSFQQDQIFRIKSSQE